MKECLTKKASCIGIGSMIRISFPKDWNGFGGAAYDVSQSYQIVGFTANLIHLLYYYWHSLHFLDE